FHATYCKEELERFKLCFGKVCLADDKTVDIAGVGDVVLKTSFGTSWTLKDVRYIPGLKKRLISVGQLDEEGYHIGFGDQQWKVSKGSLVVAHGNKRRSLYMVEVPSDGINTTIDVRGNAALWHQRLGHMSEKGMKILALKGRIPDLQKVVVGFCEPCVFGKQKKISFIKSGNTRKLQRLELVHTDVYGPTSVASIGESRYYVTFIDDSNKKVCVYFLKNKSKVFNTFKKWKAAVENETNLRVKCLKSDNGGEYSSQEFIKYCAKNAIRMLKTVLKIPQQNSVAERMNQTLNERAKSMRLHAGLPKMFWEDLVTMAAYLINCGPSVKDVASDKLDSKSVKCIFIGYGSDEMGYHFWDSKSHKVVRSRDVTFNEESLYGAKAATDSSNLTKPNQNDQSPNRSSDMSEGSENNRSFEDIGRSNKEDSKDRASFKEGGSETPQLQRSTRESRAPIRLPAGKKALQSKWVFKVKEEHDGKKRYKARLVVKGFQLKQGVDYNKIFSPVVKMTTIRGFSLSWERRKPRVQVEEKSIRIKASTETMKFSSSLIILLLYVDDMLVAGFDMAKIKKLKRQLSQEFEMKDRCSKKHVLGYVLTVSKQKLLDEREVEVLRSFNWPPSELITEDCVLPERGYSQFNDVSSGYLVSKVS
ncbi:putative RNA-directed DNA polymerase, partial [Tanacetum coccineum]